ncbi:uncharacterized protein LOC144101662 [Amblyomma americanum]
MKTAMIGLVLSAAVATVLPSTPTPPYDFFRVLQNIDKFTAAEISRADTTVLCLTGRKVDLDLVNRSCKCEASWRARSDETPFVRVNFTFLGGDSNDKLTSPDPQVGDINAHLLYTDYSTCALTKFSRHGEVCILWISDDAGGSVPAVCHEELERHCGSQRRTLHPDERCTSEADHGAH